MNMHELGISSVYLKMGFYAAWTVFALLRYPSFVYSLNDTSLVMNNQDKARFCGNKHINELFNSNNHVCCGGILHPRNVNGSVQECCNNEIYNKRLDLCCNGIYHSSYNIDQHGCCGSKVYNFKDEMCCGSQIHRLNSTRLCCGNETFDTRLQWCSSDMGTMAMHENKCGEMKYDIRKNMCCNKTLIPRKQKDARCCGSSSFNHLSHYCLRGKILRKGFLWCQHHGEYSPIIHDCCEGKLFSRNGSGWHCCGNKMINYDEYNCCAGNRYNNRNEQCCGGNVAKLEDTCCAGETIDPKTQVCCQRTLFTNEVVIQKGKPYHNKCCPAINGGKSYDSVNFACSWENRIVSRTNKRNICGRKIYNPGKDLCCNSKVFKNAARRNMACCLPSASVYNPRTHVCCFGVRRKGYSCTQTLYRPRCPRKCGDKKTTLKNYCKSSRGKFDQTSRQFRNIRKQMKSIERSRSCQCIYRQRTRTANSSCRFKESRCVSYKRLIGILVTRKSGKYILMYYRKRGRRLINDLCDSTL